MTYLVYLINYVCPQLSTLDLTSHNILDQFACQQVGRFVLFVENNELIQEYDSKLGISVSYGKYISPNLEKSKKFVNDFDAKYEVSGKTKKIFNAQYRVLSRYMTQVQHYAEHIVFPFIVSNVSRVTPELKKYFSVTFEKARYYLRVVRINVCTTLSKLWAVHVAPTVHSVWYTVLTSSVGQKFGHYYAASGLDMVFDGISKLFLSLADRSASLQDKTHFLKSELKNFIKPLDTLKSKFSGKDSEVAEVVKEIIEEVESLSSTFVEEVTEGAQAQAEDDQYDSDSDPEPSTILLTSTITVVSGSEALGSNNEVSENSYQHRLDEELGYWQSKVDKTLQLAYSSLEADFLPQLNAILEGVKGPISETLKEVQQSNYAHYKKLNKMINDISKDVSDIQESGVVPEEFSVSRQDMRDGISAATESSLEQLSSVQAKLAEAQKEVIVKYFEAIQNTIDVLESFADVTVAEFSNRLTALLSFLEMEDNYDEALGWHAWKQFHKTKEQIFQIRDKIYDEANAYKGKYAEADNEIVPLPLADWDKYFRDIHYHVGFLTHDNEEYLKLIRAKANVAYQAREALQRAKEEKQEQAGSAPEQEPEPVPESPPVPEHESEPEIEHEPEPESQPEPIGESATVIVSNYEDGEKIVVVDSNRDSDSDTVVDSDSE